MTTRMPRWIISRRCLQRCKGCYKTQASILKFWDTLWNDWSNVRSKIWSRIRKGILHERTKSEINVVYFTDLDTKREVIWSCGLKFDSKYLLTWLENSVERSIKRSVEPLIEIGTVSKEIYNTTQFKFDLGCHLLLVVIDVDFWSWIKKTFYPLELQQTLQHCQTTWFRMLVTLSPLSHS